MRRSTDRILVSHAGTAPRPDIESLPDAVKEVVRKQVESGIDIVNDGELSKSNFTNYVRDRLGGIQPADPTQKDQLPPRNINARDLSEFPQFFKTGGGGFGRSRPAAGATGAPGWLAPMLVTGPITYVGKATTDADIANFKAALESVGGAVEGF